MRWPGSRSQAQAEGQLHDAAVVQRVGDLAKCGRTQVALRLVELRVIGEVEGFGAEGDTLAAAAGPPCSCERRVDVGDATFAEGVAAQGTAVLVGGEVGD